MAKATRMTVQVTDSGMSSMVNLKWLYGDTNYYVGVVPSDLDAIRQVVIKLAETVRDNSFLPRDQQGNAPINWAGCRLDFNLPESMMRLFGQRRPKAIAAIRKPDGWEAHIEVESLLTEDQPKAAAKGGK